MVQERLRRVTAKIGYKNPETEIMIDKSQKSKGQTIDLSKRKYLSGLHNNNSGLRKELI